MIFISDAFQAFSELIRLPLPLNFWTFVLFLAFLASAGGGYYLVATSVKLVKKEVWSWGDRLRCGVFAFFFASGVLVVVTMAVTFHNHTNRGYANTGGILVRAMMICLFLLTIFPLFDFLSMAQTQEVTGLTPFQEKLEVWIINRFKPPVSYMVAFLLYVILFLIPPLVLMRLGVPFIFAFLTWELIVPITLITYYGAKGFILGLAHEYYSIPNPAKSAFFPLEPSKRMKREFLRSPQSWVITIFMCTVLGYAVLSLTQTADYFITLEAPASNMTYSFSVYITLLIGVVGYFTRFWIRKIKVRMMDILFSAYIIAAVGLNVLLRFSLVNDDKLAQSFNEWSVTAVITEVLTVNQAGVPVMKTVWLVPASMIELTVLLILVVYYVLTDRNDFRKRTLYSLVTAKGNDLSPQLPFNLVRNEDFEIHRHAHESLVTMYERLPIVEGKALIEPLYMDPLFDAVIDTHPYSSRVGHEILENLTKNHPSVILPLIEDALLDKNHTKRLVIARLLRVQEGPILDLLDSSILYSLLLDEDVECRILAIDLLILQYQKFGKTLDSDALVEGLEDPDYNVQAKVLKLATKMKVSLPPAFIFSRLNHPDIEIQRAATLAVSSIAAENLTEDVLPDLIEMMDSPDSGIQSSVLEALANIGSFKKNNIPLRPFLKNLFNPEKKVRESAKLGLIKIAEEQPEALDVDLLLKQMETSSSEVLTSVLESLGSIWELSPEKIIAVLLKHIKHQEKDIQTVVSSILALIGGKRPELVLPELVKVPEEQTFVKKGIVTRTLLKIGKERPKEVVEAVLDLLRNDTVEKRENATIILSDLSEVHPKTIPLETLIESFKSEKIAKIRRQLMKAMQNITAAAPEKGTSHIETFFSALKDSDSMMRITALKIISAIAKKNKAVVSLNPIFKLVEDEDSKIQEIALQIIGFIGSKDVEKSIAALTKALQTQNWTVRNAATQSLANLSQSADQNKKEVLEKIKTMLETPGKWSRLKALEIFITLGNEDADAILDILSVKDVFALARDEKADLDVRQQAAKLLGALGHKEFVKVHPLIVKLLGDKQEKVRSGMISGLIQIADHIPMKDLLPMLLQHLKDDEDMDVQRSVAIFFQKTAKYEAKAIKKRIVSLLQIRCDMSQDPIICKAFTELRD